MNPLRQWRLKSVDKRFFIGRIVIKILPLRSVRFKPMLTTGFNAPQPHFVLHWLGVMFQWDSPRSEQEVIKRMPKKYHYLLKGVDKTVVE